MFLKLLSTQLLVPDTQVFVEFYLGMGGYQVAYHDSSFLSRESHLAGYVFNHSLIEVTFVHKNQTLADNHWPKNFVHHSQLCEAEEPDKCTCHQALLNQLGLAMLLLCMCTWDHRQSAKSCLGNVLLTDLQVFQRSLWKLTSPQGFCRSLLNKIWGKWTWTSCPIFR